MSNCIIDEQGHFWWYDEDYPENHAVPEHYVTGNFKIDKAGATTLDLDGLMPGAEGHTGYFASVEDGQAPRAIQGVLKESGRRVLLLDAVRSGGTFHSDRFSHSEYFASFSLVGAEPPPRAAKALTFSAFDVELKGFEEWLDVGSINVVRTNRTIKLSNKRIPDLEYETSSGRLIIKHHLVDSRIGSPKHYEVALREYLSLQMHFKRGETAEGVLSELAMLQNLFIVLTDSDFPLSWPTVTVTRSRRKFSLFFHRLQGSDKPPTLRNCPVRFSSIKESFGAICGKWKSGLKEHGAGYFAFPSTKRKIDQYAENKFSNLVYGLESFHRSKFGSRPRDNALQEKIDEILSQVGTRHRRWLRGALQFQGEPSLKERLIALFSTLPIELNGALLDDFAKRCADLRNDIAHFGGKRTRESTADFLLVVSRLTEALSVLYHMVLLLDIGVSETHVRKWATAGHKAHAIRYHLAEAGLVKN
ncbi:hypothetical protein PQQ72_12770 [Paraburkholderia strydomiana]|uniref:ApeA N-terminal domain 1-containing protein n=1 Tax=Paraburkholderia strydomiana TaxID=1245417 RepID=UPI0038BB2372